MPHAACVPSTFVQSGAVFVPPAARVAPWQRVEHVRVAGLNEAEVPPAIGPKTSCVVPSACAIELGTAWHSVQATAFASAPPARCA